MTFIEDWLPQLALQAKDMLGQKERKTNIVKEARATTRRDSPFQGTWKVNPEYLESLFFLALLPFSISVEYFNCWSEDNTGKHL